MSIVLDNFDDLSVSQVDQAKQQLVRMMTEQQPSLQFQRGVLHDLLAYFGAIQGAKNSEEMRRLRESQSLLAVSADPSLADADTVDRIASNFLVSRKAGTQATGEVVVVVDSLVSATVSAGAVFEANGQQFLADTAVTARTSAALVLAPSDVLLQKRSDGTYAFNVPVTAAVVGPAGQLAEGAPLVLQKPFAHYQQAYAAADFIGGMSAETNAELIERFRYGISAKAMSGRSHMSAALREQLGFEDTVADSLIGAGDIEMQRDRHTIWPSSFGGRVDWYIRTQTEPRTATITKTATLIEKLATGHSIWQFELGRDEFPGLYRVDKVARLDSTGGAGYEIQLDARSADLSPLPDFDVLPDIVTAEEARFSRFQATVIQFKDTDIDTTGMTPHSATADYAVTVTAMGGIAAAQKYASRRDVRNAAGDCLVKAPIPCFVSLSLSLDMDPLQVGFDEAGLISAVMEFVNRTGFHGQLYSSAILDIAHNYLTGRSAVGGISMSGKIHLPNGSTYALADSIMLQIPDLPQHMVSARTTVFILSRDAVRVTQKTLQ